MDRVKTKKEVLQAKLSSVFKYLIIPVVVITGALAWTSQSSGSAANLDIDTLSITKPVNDVVSERISIRSIVEPLDSFYVDATEAGKVDLIFAEEGDYVTKGQKLLELTNTALMLNVISREALVTEQLNNLRNTRILIDEGRLNIKREITDLEYQRDEIKNNITRYEQLVKQGYVSEKELQDLHNELTYTEKRIEISLEREKSINLLRSSQLEQLEANTKRLNANLEVVKESLTAMTITAPKSGYLTNFNITQGEFLTRGARIGRVDDFSQVKLKASIDEFYLNDIETGNTSFVSINDQEYKLTVNKVYPNVESGQFEADLVFAGNLPDNLLPGQSLTATIIFGTSESVMTIPNGPYLKESFGKWVYVLSKDQEIIKRDIVIGRKSPTLVEVVGGLSATDKVVTNNYKAIKSALENRS